ncbi:MAG: oxygen-independent coproporphyrinogen III oxidase [Lachnospiraceae bacterium]|nr:oxygen-independent coproporphyrinogen III oxidase [Lachnospiraceae bacterium]
MTNKEAEIYIHIPFCIRKCAYCDFLSFASDEGTRKRYVSALTHEIAAACTELRGKRIRSVFIGGGTPSVLETGQLASILEMLFRCADIDQKAEITLECNPGTTDREMLSALRSMGISRLSIGAQSFQDPLLKTIGRIHGSAEIRKCYDDARRAGFENISLDMIFALPGQSLKDWKEDLETAALLGPEHLSAYSLILEEGTPLFENRAFLDFPDEEEYRDMFYAAGEILDRFGLHRYEISNYARPGKECIHNVGYWTGVEYLGLGLGAASLMKNRRYRNTSSMEEYFRNSESPEKIRTVEEELDLHDRMSEFLILGLRMTEGISAEEFTSRFGRDLTEEYGRPMEKYLSLGLIKKENDRIFLSEEGIFVSNTIFADLL